MKSRPSTQSPGRYPARLEKTERKTTKSSRAFTLMETLVALALCGLIVGSVGTSIDLYWKYRTQSRDRVTSAHVLRGIAEDMTCDLRSAISHVRVQSASASELPDNVRAAIESGALPTNLESTLKIQEQFLNLRADQAGTPIHFVGTRSAVAILTDLDSPRFPGPNAGYDAPSRKHVVWWVHEGQSLRLALSQVGARQIQSSLSAAELPFGLVRATEPFAGDGGRGRRKTGAIQSISRDVASIQFRYFDGFEWHTAWDSSKRIALPNAVEITLLLKDQPDKHQQFVISIPQGG